MLNAQIDDLLLLVVVMATKASATDLTPLDNFHLLEFDKFIIVMIQAKWLYMFVDICAAYSRLIFESTEYRVE
mgnify:CR=1 FL=1